MNNFNFFIYLSGSTIDVARKIEKDYRDYLMGKNNTCITSAIKNMTKNFQQAPPVDLKNFHLKFLSFLYLRR